MSGTAFKGFADGLMGVLQSAKAFSSLKQGGDKLRNSVQPVDGGGWEFFRSIITPSPESSGQGPAQMPAPSPMATGIGTGSPATGEKKESARLSGGIMQ